MSLLIRNVLLDGQRQDIMIDGQYVSHVGTALRLRAERVIDGDGLAAMPSLVNGHTHAAMTLLRGYADDMRLQPWLQDKIWPMEARLNSEDFYWGTKLGCLEMIRNGISLFNDMYLDEPVAARAAREMGLRTVQGIAAFDFFDAERRTAAQTRIIDTYEILNEMGELVIPAIAPHSIYTVSTELLRWIVNFARERDAWIHIHLSETAQEVDECMARFGMRPTHYLHSLGMLHERTIVAHCIHLDESELALIAQSGTIMVHNPVANMKLASGGSFPFEQARRLGIRMMLGTDGPCSNNSLDLFQDMRVAALLQKQISGDPTLMTAAEIYRMASTQGFDVFDINAGRIAPGHQADLILVDLRRPEMTPCHNLVSNLVYAASGGCVHSTICAGRVLMEARKVDGAEEIIDNAAACAKALVTRGQASPT